MSLFICLYYALLENKILTLETPSGDDLLNNKNNSFIIYIM